MVLPPVSCVDFRPLDAGRGVFFVRGGFPVVDFFDDVFPIGIDITSFAADARSVVEVPSLSSFGAVARSTSEKTE